MPSQAPIEIWHAILKYAISVSLFFDPGPVETYGVDILRKYSYEGPYWDSERTRNALRRVCYAWDIILKPYSHRFIRLYDVLHGHVPTIALPLAIRLDLDGSYGCKCPEICLDRTRQCWMEIERIWQETAPFSWQEEVNGAPPVAWKVEIIKGWVPEQARYYRTLKQRAPNLQVMMSQSLVTVPSPLDLPPALRLFQTDINESRLNFNIIGMKSITALHIAVGSLGHYIEDGSLPRLKHLSIDYVDNDETAPPEDVYSFLGHIGSQLHTFYLRDTLSHKPIEPRLWSALPRVERLQLPYAWTDCDVPQSHPLRMAQLSITRIIVPHGAYFERYVLPFLLHSSQHHWTVRMDTTWCECLFSPRFHLVLGIDKYYEARRIYFVDSNDETLARYIVFLLTAFWKQPGRRHRKALPESDYGPVRF